jgi:hypothetical protein
MTKWLEESPVNRAKCIAHYLHANLREAYAQAMSLKESESKSDKASGGVSYGSMMQSMGLA